MKKENENILLSGDEAIAILGEIEYLLISLRNIGNYYFYNTDASRDAAQFNEYCRETTRFVDESKITHRLAEIRSVITEKFNDELGPDDMDDIEREMIRIRVWEKPGD